MPTSAESVDERGGAVYIPRLVAPSSAAPPLLGLHLLVVDDDRVALTILCAMLRSAGAEVQGVPGGTEALDALRSSRVDFLLCDVYMPAMDGFELIRRVRQLGLEGGSTVPAVAITAHPSFENRRDAQRAGFQDLLTKPVDAATLVDVVRRLCPPAAE
jgi:CheY-like chemotaxis protein